MTHLTAVSAELRITLYGMRTILAAETRAAELVPIRDRLTLSSIELKRVLCAVEAYHTKH